MSERWVCKRCFASNEETDATCGRCQLLRGAEAPAEARAEWVPQAAAQPAWRRLLRFWWIPVAGVVLLIGYLSTAQRGSDGSLSSSGTVSVDDLRVGDCFNSEETELTEVDGTPCGEPHEYEVFAIDTHQSDALPDDAGMELVFNSLCAGEFETYVGAPWVTSSVWASMITPSEESWADGDRTFICILYDPADDALTQSLRGTAR